MTAHSRTSRVAVPLYKVPKVHVLCPKCQRGTKALFGTPHAAGYHRRHRCMDIQCDATFYTLAGYEDGTIEMSHLPFKDRPLTEFELAERDKWWELPVMVTTKDKAMLNKLDGQLRIAFGTPEQDRTVRDKFLVKYVTEMVKALERMDAQ